MTGIYLITNKINNKKYVGQAIDIQKRWVKEKYNAFHESSHEYHCARSQAFRKYGLDNFSFEVLEECSVQELNIKEQYWAAFYNTYTPYGYNVSICGEQGRQLHKLKNFNEVQQIIQDLKNTTLTNKEIGEKYGLSSQSISDINCGRRWKQDGLNYPIRVNSSSQLGDYNKKYKSIPVYEYYLQGNYIQCFPSNAEAARFHGISKTSVNDVCRGKQKTTHGMIFSYTPPNE